MDIFYSNLKHGKSTKKMIKLLYGRDIGVTAVFGGVGRTGLTVRQEILGRTLYDGRCFLR